MLTRTRPCYSLVTNQCPAHRLFSAMFSPLCTFCWWFHYLNCPPSTMLKCYLVSSGEKPWLCPPEKTRVLDELHSGMSCGAVGCESMLTSQWDVKSNEICCVQEGYMLMGDQHGKQTCISLGVERWGRMMVQSLLIQDLYWFCRTTSNGENRPLWEGVW